jgi:hypothetical protein
LMLFVEGSGWSVLPATTIIGNCDALGIRRSPQFSKAAPR